MITPTPALETPSEAAQRAVRFRWVVCGLLFLVTANNYLDRQIFGLIGPELMKIFHWSLTDYLNIGFWFDLSYAAGFVIVGRFLDIVGTRLGFSIAITCWSVGVMLQSCLGSIFGFKIVRSFLGLSEPSPVPGAVKVIAEWFPQRERAFATGLYKTGSNFGAVLVPLIVPWVFLHAGWRWTFILSGLTGFVLLALWLWLYHVPRRADGPGDDTVEPAARVPWLSLLRFRQTWGYISAKFLTDAIWHWYFYLLPLFLGIQFHLRIDQFGLPLIIVATIANAGSIGGGWLSTHLMKRGWDTTPARKLSMFICCCCVLPAIMVPHTHNVWVAVVLVGLATAAHQGWTSNLFTTVSDMYPKRAIGSIVGLGGTFGMIGAALLLKLTDHVLKTMGNYTVIFLLAGTVYLLAFAIFHLLVPRFEPVQLSPADART